MATPRSPRVISLALASAALLAVVPATVGHADPKPSLAQVEARINNLNNEIEAIAEKYDASRIALGAANQRSAVARARVAAARAALNAVRKSMSVVAADAYRSGGADQFADLLTTSTPQTFLDRASALDQIAAAQGAQLAQAATAQLRLTTASADAAAAAASQKAIARSLSSQKQQIQSILNQQQQLLAGLQADQRRQLAAMRAAEAAAAAARASRDRQFFYNGPASGRAAVAVRAALAELGKPYEWGASGPNSFDCSGLTMWAWGRAGVSLPHYTGAQWNAGRHVSRSQLEPGDLVFYYSDLHHVALYIGDGRVVQAPHTGDVVKISPIDMDPYEGAVRVG